jgi:hypothetical protein
LVIIRRDRVGSSLTLDRRRGTGRIRPLPAARVLALLVSPMSGYRLGLGVGEVVHTGHIIMFE